MNIDTGVPNRSRSRSRSRSSVNKAGQDLNNNNNNSDSESVVVVSTVMGIPLAQRRGGTGCSIAQQLWPAAEHLAEFVLQFQFQFQLVGTSNTSHNTLFKHRSMHSSSAADAAGALDALGALIKTATISATATATATASSLQLLELGAGVGLTSLKIATLLPCHVLLTDLDEALPLLHQNIQLNAPNFVCGPAAVQAQALRWGAATAQDCDSALAVLSQLSNSTFAQPILVLASDCVYFEQLHLPLEETFLSILSTAPAGS
eukprot:scaffold422024_cov63-Attheya_sp.AAC.1